jgi:hypothetical protein
METALYYTFSTVSQTLAGAIALLGAFVLYRLQMLSTDINDSADYIGRHVPDGGARRNIEVAVWQGQLDQVSKLAENGFPVIGDMPVQVRASIDKLGDALKLRESIHYWFTISLGLTIGLIGMSVVVLSVTPLLVRSACISILVLAIGILWFLSCLGSYVAILKKSVE